MKSLFKKPINLLVVIVSSVILIGCNSSSTEVESNDGERKLDKSLVLRMGHVMTENEPTHIAAEEFAKNVNERTNGEISVQLFPNSQLGSDQDLQEQAKLGNPIIGATNPTFLTDMAPDLGILSGPYLTTNWDDLKKIIESDYMKEQEVLLQSNGLRVLAFNWYFGERHVISNKEIHNPGDLKGVKLRSSPSPMWEETIKGMGASPTPLPWAEVYPALEQNVINGAEAPMSTLYSSKLYEVATTVSKTGHFNQVNGWVMSEDIFSSLPQEYQDILIEEARKAGEKMSEETLKQSEKFENLMIEEGVNIVEVDKNEFESATKKVYDTLGSEWSEGLYERIKSIIE